MGKSAKAVKLNTLEQRRNKLATEMRSLDSSIGENVWTPEQRDQFAQMRSELQALDADIQIQKDLHSLDNMDNISDESRNEARDALQDKDLTVEQRHNKVFDIFVRNGFEELDSEQRTVLRRSQSVGDNGKGGFTVPAEFQARVIELMKDFGGVEQRAQVIPTSDGREMDWTVTDGTNDEGDFVGEGQDGGSADIEFTMVKLGAKKLTSKSIIISNELLQDTAINMDDLIGRRIASRIGRKKAKAIIQGTGTGLQNKGLALQVTGKTTIKTAAKFTYQDINELIHSVDPAYRNGNFALALNDNTLKMLENMEDGQGRPLWLPAVAGGAPATILGKPYFIDQGIPDATGTNVFMYAGDWKRFIVRNVRYFTLKRLTEKYAESDQTAFIAFHRFDTLLEDTAAIKGLAWKAS